MPGPVPLPIRQAISRRHQQGSPVSELAAAFGLAPRTVRGLIQRARGGAEALAAARPGPARGSRAEHPARAAALRLRREHPAWGAGLIRVILERQGIEPAPGTRSLQRWFAAAGLGPAPRGRRTAAAARRAAAPHDTWQVDAAEDIPLAGGSRASWLRIADEFTGAVLATAVFPPREMEQRAGRRDPAVPPRGVHPLGPADAGACR